MPEIEKDEQVSSGLLDTEPAKVEEVKPAKAESAGEEKPATQEELDWRQSFPEELKTHKSLLKFKTSQNLAESYLEAERKLSTLSNISHLSKDSSMDEVGKTLRKLFNLGKKEEYKVEGVGSSVSETAYELGIKQDMLKQLAEKFNEDAKVSTQKAEQEQLVKWKEEFIAGRAKDEVDKDVLAGLKFLDMTPEKYKDTFGTQGYNPKMLGFIEGLGKKAREEDVAKVREGKSTGNLPSSHEELLAMYDEATIREVDHRNKGELSKAEEVSRELDMISAKLAKVRKSEGTPFF